MGWLGSPHKRPSDVMLDVLEGRLAHDDAPAAIQSLCSKAYFDAAMQIIREDNKEKRRKMLTRIPNTCDKQVRQYVELLWPRRQQLLR